MQTTENEWNNEIRRELCEYVDCWKGKGAKWIVGRQSSGYLTLIMGVILLLFTSTEN